MTTDQHSDVAALEERLRAAYDLSRHNTGDYFTYGEGEPLFNEAADALSRLMAELRLALDTVDMNHAAAQRAEASLSAPVAAEAVATRAGLRLVPVDMLATVPASPVAPAGWRLVPIEPTEAMVRAGAKGRQNSASSSFRDGWKLALNAAPSPTDTGGADAA